MAIIEGTQLPAPDKPKVHIGYDHESLRVGIIGTDGKVFNERGLLEDCDHIETLKLAFEALGCEVTTELEY